MVKLLICGTRKKGYEKKVREALDRERKNSEGSFYETGKFFLEIVEGCCPDSADEYAERWAKETNVKIYHFPSTSGNYLKRNIDMVEFADEVLAFWDGYSYGTAHAIATAIKLNKPVRIIEI
jgi:hypothetical protein